MNPEKVVFFDQNLEDSFNGLSEYDPLKRH